MSANDARSKNRLRMIFSLLFATVIRIFFVILSYGCKVPAGIFVPSMAVGATFGRMVGIIVQAIHEAFPDSSFFSACEPDVPCITPGTYAFLGAGAALSGIMHITVSVVVIMFELTGALTYILPTMIVVGVTKAISDRMSRGGIADRMIRFNGFPFLDNKEDHSFGVPVSQAMTTNPTFLPASGLVFGELVRMLRDNPYQGYPVVEDDESRTLIGFLGRTELLYGISRVEREQKISKQARCYFSPEDARSQHVSVSATNPLPAVSFDTMSATAGSMSVDFSRFIERAPISVHPRLPLETVMEMFKKLGPRVVLIEYRGKLQGLITVKDCLKYQVKVEAREHPVREGEDSEVDALQERVWGWLVAVGTWVKRLRGRRKGKWPVFGGGLVRLGEEQERHDSVAYERTGTNDPDSLATGSRSLRDDVAGEVVELEDR
jgi:chloride channel 3/4/5